MIARPFSLALAALGLAAGGALAHHGWGSYDAAHPVTVSGRILTSKFETRTSS
jgi:hypothetical protein